MAIDDYIDLADLYFEEDQFSEYRVTCKYCGATNLRWEKIENKWFLIELNIKLEEIKHICKKGK